MKRSFSTLAVLTLGLGIGVNSALFSVLDGLLFRALPFDSPEALVTVALDRSASRGGGAERLSPLDLADLDAEPALFEEVAGWRSWEPTLTGFGEARVIRAAVVTEGLFSRVLQVQPTVGRSFMVEEDRPGGTPTAVLSQSFWLEHFGGERSALGRAVVLDGVPLTVIGVMPEGFAAPFMERAQLWTAAQLDAARCGRGCAAVEVIGRLRDGVALEVARDRTFAVGRRLAETHPETHAGTSLIVADLRSRLVGSMGASLGLLWGAVVFVLLIACTNVAGLLLVRRADRDAEFAVREALGAGRWTLLRQLLGESLELAALGGVLGLGLAAWGTDVLIELSPLRIADRGGLALSGRVLAFTATLSLGTGLVFGFVPAWRAAASRASPAARLGRRGGRHRLRGSMVVSQIAMATVLLVGAGLLMRSLRELEAADLGYEPDHVLALSVALPADRLSRPVEQVLFYDELLSELEAIPEIVAVGATTSMPLDGSDRETRFRLEGSTEVGGSTAASPVSTAWLRQVTDDYLFTIGQRVLEGRGFDDRDAMSAPPVVVVNESFATRHLGYPHANPVGRRISLDAAPEWRTLVGIVRDTRHFDVRDADEPAIYAPFSQVPASGMTVALRSDADLSALAADARAAVARVDPTLALARVEPMDRGVSATIDADRFATRLLTTFALLALVLASVGLYGVVSYGVKSRIRELGIRLALGAAAADVRAIVVRGGVWLTLAGLVIGLAGALALTPIMESFLYGVSPSDPFTYVVTAVVLAGVAMGASWLPARRAAVIDPASALREER